MKFGLVYLGVVEVLKIQRGLYQQFDSLTHHGMQLTNVIC